MKLNLDYETYSACDIRACGTYRYAADPSTEILMLAWALDDGPVNLWQPHLEESPPGDLVELLQNAQVTKRAFNAAFERQITLHCLGIDVPVEQWECSQVASLSLGFPAHLDGVLEAIGLRKKDPRGTRLIQMFSVPNPVNYKVPRYDWDTHPAEWQEFCDYCVRDVEVERALWLWLEGKPANLAWEDWYVDQHINTKGLPFDLALAEGAEHLLTREKRRLSKHIKEITGLEKVTRGPLLHWLANQGVFLPDTRKDTIANALLHGLPKTVAPVLKAWTEYSTRAGDKFKAALRSAVNGRLYGVFQMNGAARTGRWAGRIIQPHNLRSTIAAPEQVNALAEHMTMGDTTWLRIHWPDELLSDLIGSAVRHGIQAPEGQCFAVCDWSSIESRILGWLTYCNLINQTFANHRDTYKVFAAEYFRVPYAEVTKEQRKFAKPPTLGCGYQLGVDGLITYAEGYGVALTEAESSRAVDTFRTMYAEVPRFWYRIEEMVKQVLRGNGVAIRDYRLWVWRDTDFLYIQLPSGRNLCYYRPRLERKRAPWCEPDDPAPDMIESITYMGVNQYLGNRWMRLDTYGGKLTENIVQAIAADILREGLRSVSAQLDVRLHVHDEIAALVPKEQGQQALALMQELMSRSPVWANDLLLDAEGWTGTRYAKF